jgi:hypothetical protein
MGKGKGGKRNKRGKDIEGRGGKDKEGKRKGWGKNKEGSKKKRVK